MNGIYLYIYIEREREREERERENVCVCVSYKRHSFMLDLQATIRNTNVDFISRIDNQKRRTYISANSRVQLCRIVS